MGPAEELRCGEMAEPGRCVSVPMRLRSWWVGQGKARRNIGLVGREELGMGRCWAWEQDLDFISQDIYLFIFK